MFEQKNLWKEIGYSVIEGELEDGKRVVLARTGKNVLNTMNYLGKLVYNDKVLTLPLLK